MRNAKPANPTLDAATQELAQRTGSIVVSSKIDHPSVNAMYDRVMLECAKRHAIKADNDNMED